MKLVWRARARADVTTIIAYIERASPAGAAKIQAEIGHGISFLLEWPELGRRGRLATRELIVAHGAYLVIYKVIGEKVIIQRVVHASRKRR